MPKCVKTMNALPFKGDTWMSLHTGGRNGNEGDLASLHGLFANGIEFGEIKREVDAVYNGFPRGDWLNNTRKSPGKYALANACSVSPQRREVERERVGASNRQAPFSYSFERRSSERTRRGRRKFYVGSIFRRKVFSKKGSGR